LNYTGILLSFISLSLNLTLTGVVMHSQRSSVRMSVMNGKQFLMIALIMDCIGNIGGLTILSNLWLTPHLHFYHLNIFPV
jgi:hypothetical protein